MLKLPFRLVRLPFRITFGVIRIVGVRRLLLIGIGVGIGVLIAPDRGAETRKRLEAYLTARTEGGELIVAAGANRISANGSTTVTTVADVTPAEG